MKKMSYLFWALLSLMVAAYLGAVEKPSTSVVRVKTDDKSIENGKALFNIKCAYCHDPYSTNTLIGPGLKGILKNATLPVSKKPAVAENVANQLRHPLTNMPSFVYLSEDDVEDIIAFMNTL